MPDRVKSFREIDSRQNRPRARPGFVKPIRNGLRKVQNLIKCRPSRVETGLYGLHLYGLQVGSTSGVPEGVMSIKVPKNEEISGGGKDGGRKGIGSAIRHGGANRGAYTLRKESEKELLREMLIPT